jgi:hypothetical protein
MSYGVSIRDLLRRAVTYVDKILKGAKPANLPVEQSMKFELVINLKTAMQIGLTIPQSVLYRADRMIKLGSTTSAVLFRHAGFRVHARPLSYNIAQQVL